MANINTERHEWLRGKPRNSVVLVGTEGMIISSIRISTNISIRISINITTIIVTTIIIRC